MGADWRLRSRPGRVGLILAVLPIGTGAAQFFFGSLAPEWRAPADTVSPRTPAGYAVTTLFYTFALGMSSAAFTAMVLAIIGHTAAATKINLYFALNTLFSLGMLRVAGWAHDAWGSAGMLYTEALTGVAALAVFALLAGRVTGTRLAEESGRA